MNSSLETLASRIVSVWFMDHVSEDGTPAASPISSDTLQPLLDSQSPNGSWPDIDYSKDSPSLWEPAHHLERTLLIARAAQPSPTPPLLSAFHRALHYWLHAHPVCSNWWWNVISCPRTTALAALVLRHHLLPAERALLIQYLDNQELSPIGRTGQNKVWRSWNVLCRHLLAHNDEGVLLALERISSELHLSSTVEGIQPDGSFHQHGNQIQMGNYGLGFLSDMSSMALAFSQTPFAFNESALDALQFLFLEGYCKLSWHARFDVASVGRQCYPNALQTKFASFYLSAARLSLLGRPALSHAWQCLRNEHTPPYAPSSFTGFTFFWTSAFAVYRQPTWMTTLRMHTPSIIGWEQVNEDNYFGGHTADGTLHTVVSGREYEDIFPLWNWRHLPGITSYSALPPNPSRSPEELNTSSFLHAASHGDFAAVAFSCDREGLLSHKLWLFTPSGIFCLGSGISSSRDLPVQTTLQSANGIFPVLLWDSATGSFQPLSEPLTLPFSSPLKLRHDHLSYVLQPTESAPHQSVSISCHMQSGDFAAFMRCLPPSPRTAPLFELALHHGAAPQNDSYAYWILPNASENDLAAFDPNTHLRILFNTPDAQILLFPTENLLCVAIRIPGTYLLLQHPVTFSTCGLFFLSFPS